jgi:4-hydroxy-3-methylbut-2-enyl diphosphate reductase
VQDARDLLPEWFIGANVVGITAGTSTPDVTIDAVELWLKRFADQRNRQNVPAEPEDEFHPRKAA